MKYYCLKLALLHVSLIAISVSEITLSNGFVKSLFSFETPVLHSKKM